MRRVLPHLVALIAALVVAVSNAPALGATFAYTPPVQFCDGTNGTPAHNATAWHPLVERRTDGSVLCTYGHDHGIAPDAGNAAEFSSRSITPDSTISGPWATTSPTNVPENGTDNKHRAYKNIAWTYRWCDSSAPEAVGLYDFSGQFHADANVGSVPRFHSFHIKAVPLNCTNGGWGQLEFSGHLDYANLVSGSTVVDTGDNTGTGCPIGGDIRQANNPSSGTQDHDVWYGETTRPPRANCYPRLLANETNGEYGFESKITLQDNLQMSGFGPVDPANPTALLFFSPRAGHVGTYLATDAMNGALTGFDGYVTHCTSCESMWPNAGHYYHLDYDGWTDRHGRVVAGCTTPSVDCNKLTAHLWTGPTWLPGEPIKYQGLLFPQGNAYQLDVDVPGPQGQAGYYVKDPS